MPKERCAFPSCKTALTLTSSACKCEKKFCAQHRHAETHQCSFDYRASGKEGLMKLMSKPIIAEKLASI
jgi:predicted nucleic acid binding AN1-type Zn finger protein